ncbi:restriction endonuclease subunit S [Christensenellaceae bacterium OttesenSCG-928-L17]|nr:restriction endonuclease subunit S [Christensenellaceae bacterium OttesenSCG-928-L17]
MPKAFIKDLCSFGNGMSIPRSKGQIPAFGGNGVTSYVDKKNHSGEVIIIGRVGAYCGSVHYYDGNCWITDNALYIEPNGKVDGQFLALWLKMANLNRLHIGSSQPLITQGIIGKILVNFPDVEAQRKIAEQIFLIDRKIELNDKTNIELEVTARLIYDQWFTQFDFPDEFGRPYKTSGGKMVYDEALKREIPVNWEVGNLRKNSLTEIIKPKIEKFSGKKTYIATADVNDMHIGAGSQIDYENRESRANMQPTANSVWFAKMEKSVKHILVGKWSKDLLDSAIFSTGFMGLKAKDTAFAYLAGFVRQPHFELVKDSNSHGATMSGIGNDDLRNIKLIIPTNKILHRYSESVNPILQQIDINRQESLRLAELRDWLLPMLMNGQVQVG